MRRPTTTRTALTFAALLSGVAGAECSLQSTGWTVPRYNALMEAKGTLKLVVSCDAADSLRQYTLKVSALGGRFDQTTGAYVVNATGKSNSVLQMQILGASPALGGTVVPTVYTGSQELVFPVTIPAGQWGASGTPSIGLSFDLSPYATGNALP
ncbi:hypothetical protein [Deinococcus sp.]|uniref:hypothetical protein n=1 Tax=Deinococcus sp. TaxID=47478 RepID=UPI003C7D548C